MNPVFLYVVWSAIAIAVVASAVLLIRVLVRLRPLIDRLDGTAQFLETSRPKVERILDSLEAELVELRGISEKANRIVGSAESVTTDLRDAVRPLITEVSDLGQSVRHVRAAAVAVRAGLTAWRDRRHANGEEPPAELDNDEER
jgi:uncharacterized protein YoxC